MGFMLAFVATIFLGFTIQWCFTKYKIVRNLKRFTGPRPLPVIGNVLEVLARKGRIEKLQRLTKEHGGVLKLWIGPSPMLFIQDTKFVELLLTSKSLNKSIEYTYIKDWIGQGLLGNNGDARWFKHRKILTPAFHYNVLEKFLPVFNSVCNNFVKKLEDQVGNHSFDITKIMNLYTIDNICECVMGTTVNALGDINSKFVKSVEIVSNVLIQRLFNPLLQPEILFRLSKLYKKNKSCIEYLNNNATAVMLKRQHIMHENGDDNQLVNGEDDIGKKRRLAFLDLLLEAAEKDPTLTEQQIREEVATFMLAGPDTLQSALNFCCYSLATNKEIQDKVVEELRSIFGDDKNRPVTLPDLNNMKYMEAVLKETLRLYPPIPMFAKTTREDLEYAGSTISKGITLVIFPFALHRDPDIYPDPTKFDPDRFIFGARVKKVHEYIPFSAGPRDCIGKKFAMMQMKLTMAMLLRNFEFFSAIPHHELQLVDEVVLMSSNGIRVRIEKRNF